MRSRILIALLAVAAIFGFAQQASAQDSEAESISEYSVISIDASETTAVAELSTLETEFDGSSIAVTVDRAAVEISDSSEVVSSAKEITFVVDLNGRAGDEYLVAVKQGLKETISSLEADTKVRIVTAGEFAQVASDTDGSQSAALTAVDGLKFSGDTSINKAIDLAASLPNVDNSLRSIVMISSGAETIQEVEAPTSILGSSGAQLFVLQTGETVGNQIPGLVDVSRGHVLLSSGDIASDIAKLTSAAAKRWQIEFSYPEDLSGKVPVTFDNTRLSFQAGSVTSGAAALAPLSEVAESATPGFLGSWVVFGISAILAIFVIGFAVYSLVHLVARQRENAIDGVLSTYISGKAALEDPGSQAEQLIQSAIVKRAINAAETFGEKRGFTERISNKLERADLPLRAGEGLVGVAVAAALLSLIAYIFTSSIVLGVLVVFAVAAGSYFAIHYLANRRLRKFELQLPDTLQLLAGTLRAGYSLPQGLDAVSNEVAEPMASELAKAMSETTLGRDMEEALGEVGQRMDSPDFAWTVLAVGIQREVGGNLNELLTTVADTITQRERLRGEVKALTAEGRISAAILALMPPAIMLVIFIMNPDYIMPLFTEVIGLVLLTLGVVAGVIGLLWMKKVITIDA